jgi:hypothetical protein
MPRFVTDPNRLNFTVTQTGKEYNLRLIGRAQSIFNTLLGLLPSNYVSLVQGPNYTNEMKAVAVELARIELALEDVDTDRSFPTTRPDFLYSMLGYLLLLNGRLPPLAFDDSEFRKFLLDLVRIYFQGSVPKSMRDAVQLFYSGTVKITENFLRIREGASGYDISDQFGFQIDVTVGGGTIQVGSGASLTTTDGDLITVTGLTSMSTNSVGRRLVISNAASSANNGTFEVTQFLTPSSVKIQNASAVANDANNGSIGWKEETPPVSFPADVFSLDSATRILLDIIRPAHTLFRVRYIFTDRYLPNDTIGRVLDTMKWALSTYYYDDFRSYWGGLRDIDRLGNKEAQVVEDEDHSNDF